MLRIVNLKHACLLVHPAGTLLKVIGAHIRGIIAKCISKKSRLSISKTYTRVLT